MQGDRLLPLSELFLKDPTLHKKYLAKYAGKEEVMERQIPLLDCGWNEVIQLLPLDPRQLFELQKQLGLIAEIPNYRYFKINPSILVTDNTVVYFKTAPGDENVTVKWLSDIRLEDLQTVPDATERYYETMRSTGEPVFNYQFAPHILYRGSIDISSVEVMSLRK